MSSATPTFNTVSLHDALPISMVIRFQDLLRHRVVQLNQVFLKAIKEEGYKGDYRGVFPIKVNQLREVVDEIVAAGKEFNFGRSEEHTSELQSLTNLVCRLLLE